MDKYLIFTDGGSRLSKNIGAYATVVFEDLDEYNSINQLLQAGRCFEGVTNNQMELFGFISGFTRLLLHFKNKDITLSNSITVTIVSDSEYLVKGCTEYIHNWRKNGFKTYSKKPVKNYELWKVIDELLNLPLTINFSWVKGHSDPNESIATLYNNDCDQICNELMDRYLNEGKSKGIADNTLEESLESVKSYLSNLL